MLNHSTRGFRQSARAFASVANWRLNWDSDGSASAATAKKVIYLAVTEAAKKWTMPIRNWRGALNRFTIEFEERLADYV